MFNFSESHICAKTFDTHAVVHTCSSAVVPHRNPTLHRPHNRWRWTGAVWLCIYISVWQYGPFLSPLCYSSRARASLSGHFTHLYPFLSLLAGWFGMVRLQPFRVVPRRSIRDISTCCGTSHLRAGRLTRTRESVGRWWYGDTWYVIRCVVVLPSPLCQPVILLLAFYSQPLHNSSRSQCVA